MTIGQQLRAAREEKGMSIGDVARRTCIQPKFLRAIDDDDFGAMPDSHRKLFVREYAKSVELDPAGVLSLLPDYVPPPAAPQGEPAPPRATRSISTSAPAPSDHDRREYREILQRLSSGKGNVLGQLNLTMWLVVAACLLLVAGGVYYFFLRSDEPEAPATAAAHGSADTTTTPTTDSTGTATVADTAAAASTVATGDSLTLLGRAIAPVWYSIVMDGKRSETGTLDSGGTKIWRAGATFRISLGNAGGLSLTLNDKPIGTLGLKKTIVRNQLIDATGIVRRGTTTRRPAVAAPARRMAPASHAITPTQLRP